MTAGPLYETLARFQWWRRRWSRAAAGEGLEMRKRLLPPAASSDGPVDGGEGLDRWLMGLLADRSAARVLDLGCGFGASAQRWARLGGSSVVGVTPSGYQVARANAAARAAGLGDRCRFVQQDLSAPLREGQRGAFDVVLAIEALGHTADLAAVLRNVRAALGERGVFVWVEDLVRAPLDGDADAAELARRWSSPPLRSVAATRAELAAAGLDVVREVDLTAQVSFAPAAHRDRSAVRLQRWRAIAPLPPVRRLVDAFLGGLALERLYARGVACYRVCMSERRTEAT